MWHGLCGDALINLVVHGFQLEPVNYSVRTLWQRRGNVSVCPGANGSHGNVLSEGSAHSTNCRWHLTGEATVV